MVVGSWKTILSYWECNFSGAMLNFGRTFFSWNLDWFWILLHRRTGISDSFCSLQIIATKQPVGHPKLVAKSGNPPQNTLNSGLGIVEDPVIQLIWHRQSWTIASENGWLEDYFCLWVMSLFRVYVQLWGMFVVYPVSYFMGLYISGKFAGLLNTRLHQLDVLFLLRSWISTWPATAMCAAVSRAWSSFLCLGWQE